MTDVLPGIRASRRVVWIREAARHVGDACLVVPWAVGNNGYASFRVGGVTKTVHRFVCEAAHGAPPAGHDAAHRCLNRRCANPAHLRWTTRLENINDGVAAKRHAHGERLGTRRHTEALVREVRQSPERGCDVAKRLELPRSTVSLMRSRKTWKYVA